MKKVTVLGAGESGIGAAILSKKLGYETKVSDAGKIKEKYKNVLSNLEIWWEEETHSIAEIGNADLVIKSPGIPEHVAIVQHFVKKEIPVISEIEFGAKNTHAQLIGITGSNGKTTTTMLTYHMLKQAGLKVGLAGNVGQSFAKQVAENQFEYYVIELSSFQLDGMFSTCLDIAILLNISPDHLDRYKDFDAYADSKMRVTQNQTKAQYLIYNLDDPTIQKAFKRQKTNATLIPISLEKELKEGAWIKNNQLNINTQNKPFTMSIFELALKGKHNQYNSMAAGVTGRILDLRKESVRESLEHFENVEHRLEFVAKVHGITFINDSKATNVNAAWYALESMGNDTVWIVGGVDKGNDYADLMPLVKDKVKAIIALGVDNQKILDTFSDSVEIIAEANSAKDAVRLAYQLAEKPNTVLLSPACASFDLFDSYEDRGQQFKNAVRGL